MPQQVFIKVVGFTDAERDSLATLFRLSRDRPTSYVLWSPGAQDAPALALLDGGSPDARVEAASPFNAGIQLVWVGDNPPEGMWRAFPRPLAWPDVVENIDEHFSAQAPLEFDLDIGGDTGPDTLPPELVPDEPAVARRALIASPDADQRLYLRAKLALHQLTVADEAETAAQALELASARRYTVALVDLALPVSDGWQIVRQLTAAEPRIPHLIVFQDRPSVPTRLRAWLSGIDALLPNPPDPEKLHVLLNRVN